MPAWSRYFDEAVKTLVSESGIELIELFGYEYGNDYTVQDGLVCFVAKACVEGAAHVHVRAQRMINGRGFDLHPKLPLSFTKEVDCRVRSLIPGDVAAPDVQAQLRYPIGPAGLIVVVGSGKTAMDCMIKLAALGESVTSRV
eukprot:COSAG01_NODE_15765_length_1302_cov_1.221945_1_plen_141_part_10